MTHWLRNPLLHFVLLGGLLFVGREVWQQRDGARTPGRQRPAIIITAQQLSQLQTDFAQQWGVPPTKAQMQGLIQDAVDAELLYREARRLRLDFEDRSIRARLVQRFCRAGLHLAAWDLGWTTCLALWTASRLGARQVSCADATARRGLVASRRRGGARPRRRATRQRPPASTWFV